MIYKVFLYHQTDKSPYESTEIIACRRSQAIDAAFAYKRYWGSDGDFFIVVDGDGKEIYHSNVRTWEDQRIP